MKISHPMSLSIPDDFDIESNPFVSLPESRLPVVGRDLKMLASKLRLSVIDSSWFYGLTVAAWYEYTKDPTEKIRSRYQKKIKKLEVQRHDIINKIQNSRDKELKVNLENIDTEIEALEEECRSECAKKERDELQACQPRRRPLSSGKEDELPVAKKPGNAVDLPLALLVHLTNQMPFLVQSLPLSDPHIELFADLLEPHTEKDFSFYVGRDENAAYRWRKGMNPPSTAVKRLIHMLSVWFLMEPAASKDQRIKWWVDFVNQERRLLGDRIAGKEEHAKRVLPPGL
ncbi:hypothetical protein GZ77_05130 [Endozoicomonas montiporae]|uniref:Uncharacterized protein n=2 Tax=Endozoicomonas montiporae TaxID=1027273 RepID=A0A081NBS2_9GAMM|nr:hypothetical protein [Endozoicomonas montiporae]AMO56199.1 hypothetical protein EZMO1_2080 [Endozoicomonas montiporae CL-33]KEQ15895.1 hypothetical protein GZ77_05130 [Endozoicomonas montiporae]